MTDPCESGGFFILEGFRRTSGADPAKRGRWLAAEALFSFTGDMV